MAETQPKKWGLFPPLSVTFPTKEEVARNDQMIEELKQQNNFESPEETKRRSNVLNNLQKITVEFVKEVGRKKGLSQTIINESGGKVATFGSFRLGVFGPGSDIDTLVVAPKHVSRDDFFDVFPSILQKLASPGTIEELKAVKDAHVPIIKLEYSGISIDLIFARLLLSSVPFNLDLKNDDLLRGLDDVDQRCLNGTRVSDLIISLVPQEKTFRHTLRTIKLWAQSRAIYANVMGFPGGVAWAMMVASVCQSYPQACGAVVVSKFFHLIGHWNWPRPIVLKQIEENPPGMNFKIWNPMLYRSDKNHLMPIITPAYPSMCATHNITQSTAQIITKELRRGNDIAGQISSGKLQWKSLFERHTFFTKDYKYYLSLIAVSKSREAQLIWSGLVESKVRRLVAAIDESQPSIACSRPFTKGFDRVHQYRNDSELEQILHGKQEFVIQDSKHTDISNDAAHVAVAEGNADGVEAPSTNGESKDGDQGPVRKCYTTTYYIGIELAKGSTSLDISNPVKEFQRQCEMWPQFNSDLHKIKVIHVRNYDLPNDCFEPEETRPTRTKIPKGQKKPASGNSTATPAPPTPCTEQDHAEKGGKKRSLSAVSNPEVPGKGAVKRHQAKHISSQASFHS